MIDVVILAAGLGSRLNSSGPKSLNTLTDGRTIMRQQLDNVRAVFGSAARVHIVVGFKYSMLMEHVPNVLFVYNDEFDVTNTNRSLLRALRLTGDGPCLWMNGDVVFDPEVLRRLCDGVGSADAAVAVQTVAVADEEVKFVSRGGRITELSKVVPLDRAEGEAVGVNLVAGRGKAALIGHLEQCDDQDYFERGLELGIASGLSIVPIDTSDLYAVEVDTHDDLERARGVHAAALQLADSKRIAGVMDTKGPQVVVDVPTQADRPR